jgi:starch synthase
MKILFISSEVAPFSKTGGLGDVAGALPGALARLGHEVKVVTPLYATVKQPGISPLGLSVRIRFPVTELYVELYGSQLAPGHQVVLLHHPGLYGRNGVYGDQYGDFGDNHLRFGLLTVGALSAAQAMRFEPDIVHLNDWPTGLGAVALRRGYAGTPLHRARTVFTIHNLAYQGLFPKRVMDELGLPWDLFRDDGLELHDAVNFLRAGVAWSDAVTAVSRRYAQEIMTPDLGCQLDGFIQARAGKLHGILNGVDYTEWDPSTDRHLPAHFTPDDLSGKAACKKDLRARFALPPETEHFPLYSIVSRLADQKGVDLLLSVMHAALSEWNLNFVALGSSRIRAVINTVALQGIILGLLPLFVPGHHVDLRSIVLVVVAVGLKGFVIPAFLVRAATSSNSLMPRSRVRMNDSSSPRMTFATRSGLLFNSGNAPPMTSTTVGTSSCRNGFVAPRY